MKLVYVFALAGLPGFSGLVGHIHVAVGVILQSSDMI